MEVHRVQCDELGGSEESIKVDFPHGTGDAVVACGGTNEPTIFREGVVDVFAFTDRACFVVVRVLGVTSLNREGKQKYACYLYTHQSVSPPASARLEYFSSSNRFNVFNDKV